MAHRKEEAHPSVNSSFPSCCICFVAWKDSHALLHLFPSECNSIMFVIFYFYLVEFPKVLITFCKIRLNAVMQMFLLVGK